MYKTEQNIPEVFLKKSFTVCDRTVKSSLIPDISLQMDVFRAEHSY